MKVLLFTITALLSASTFAFTFGSDVPQDIRDQITTDLAFMKSLQGSQVTPLHQQIFGTLDGKNYGNFFESRVTDVGLDDCGDAKAVACVIPWYGASSIWLTPNYTKFSHPQIAKMMVVFHEARHTESKNGNWAHATCPTPFVDANGKEILSIWTGATLAGEAACDSNALGSYGSSTILLKNISMYCTNCTDKVKQDAGLYADDQYKRLVGKAKTDAGKDLYGN